MTLPSLAVQIMESRLPALKGGQRDWRLGPDHEQEVGAILAVIDAIPAELIVLPPDRRADYVAQLGKARTAVESWRARGSSSKPLKAEVFLAIRDHLAACSDSVAAAGSTELLFVTAVDLRQSLLADQAEARRGLVAESWKSTTVMAGSVIEALLLWAIETAKPAAIDAAVTACVKAGMAKPAADRTKWHLSTLSHVSAQLGIVTATTATQVEIAAGFRNLIHAGATVRLQQTCDAGTAYAAFAALEATKKDLAKRFW